MRQYATLCTGSAVAAVGCVCLAASICLATQASAQQPATPSAPTPRANALRPGANANDGIDKLFSHSFLSYTESSLPTMQFTDSRGDLVRAKLLMQDGEIRLSLKDAIALAIENNLDIESVRLLSPMARADLARARSGQLLRNVPAAIGPGSLSASGNLQTASPFGFTTIGSPGGILSGLTVQLSGSLIPNTEPVIFANGRVMDSQLPQANQAVTGTADLETHEQDLTFGLRKGFFTGTNLTLQFDSFRINRNAPYDTFDPSIQGDASVRIDQHLLQGFGWKTNRRAVYIAVNNSKIADLTFRQQVMMTVSQVLGLYYDLSSFQQQQQVIAAAVLRSQTDIDAMSKRLDMGMISQSDLIGAQIDLAQEQQAMVDAQAQIAEQEATLKTVLTHAGLEDPRIVQAHIIPTDAFPPMDPATFDMRPEWPEKMADLAVLRRPEIEQGALALANKHLGLLGTRSALRPTFDVYGIVQSNALAGQLNPLATASLRLQAPHQLIGGVGTVFNQLTGGTYPDYEAGFQLNVPLVNRAARSDLARDQVELRQQEISQQTLRNQIRLQALKAAMGLKSAKSFYDLSVQSRKLAELNLDTEQKRYDFGTSDPAHFRAAHTGLDRARIQEIVALNTYAHAKVNLQAILDQTIEANDIVLDSSVKPVH